jgi:hypothetical protein
VQQQANQHTETPILFTCKNSKLKRKNYRPKPPKSSSTISNGGITSYSIESTRGSQTLIYKHILDANNKIWAQELGIGAISPMVEPQLEGDKDADLVFTTLWSRPDG